MFSEIEWTGFLTVRVFADGSWIAPHDAMHIREDGDKGRVCKWNGYEYDPIVEPIRYNNFSIVGVCGNGVQWEVRRNGYCLHSDSTIGACKRWIDANGPHALSSGKDNGWW